MSAAQVALHELREAQRAPIPTVDDFTFLLSSTLDVLGIEGVKKGISVSPAGGSTDGTIKALDRSLGSVQQALLATSVPTFLYALDKSGRTLLEAFFCPPTAVDRKQALLRTHIAQSTYQTLSAQLSVRQGIAPLPIESRAFVLDILNQLAGEYGLKELYNAIWSNSSVDAESSKAASGRQLQWEDSIKVLVSLPAKVVNAVGRWSADGWKGDVPDALLPK